MILQIILSFLLAGLFLFGLLKIINRLQLILLELHTVRSDLYHLDRFEEE